MKRLDPLRVNAIGREEHGSKVPNVQRWRWLTAGSGSAADAVGGRLQCEVRRGTSQLPLTSVCSNMYHPRPDPIHPDSGYEKTHGRFLLNYDREMVLLQRMERDQQLTSTRIGRTVLTNQSSRHSVCSVCRCSPSNLSRE